MKCKTLIFSNAIYIIKDVLKPLQQRKKIRRLDDFINIANNFGKYRFSYTELVSTRPLLLTFTRLRGKKY